MCHIYQVHRAAFPFGAARHFSVQFRNHLPEVAAFRQIRSVTAIGRKYHILRPQCFANTHRHRFLPD